jgi:hypothetical protein
MRLLDICLVEYSVDNIRPVHVSAMSTCMRLECCAYCFLMLAQRSMYHSAIEENFRSVGDVVEDLQGFLELVIVIVGKRFHPCFDFLCQVSRFGCIGFHPSQLVPASKTYPSRKLLNWVEETEFDSGRCLSSQG